MDTQKQPAAPRPEPVATTEVPLPDLVVGREYEFRPLRLRGRLTRIGIDGVHLDGLAGPVDPRNLSPIQ
jgi:hypothetical protein